MLFEIHIPNRDAAALTLSMFLIVDLYAASVGVYQYQKSDGQLYNAYKSLDEIARPETLNSILGCPLSIHHPPDFLGPENFQQWLQWRFSGVFIAPGTMDGRRVRTRAILYSREAIDAVWNGDLTEISMGSWYKAAAESGNFEGLSYTVSQTWITYNHGSLYEPGGGRLGSSVGVSMDGKDLVYCTHKTPGKELILPTKTKDSKQPEAKTMLIPLNDGKTVDVPDAVAADVLAHIKAQDSRITQLTNTNTTAAAKLAVYEAHPPAATAQANDAAALAEQDAKVQERQQIIDSARNLLPQNYVFQGKANSTIMLDSLSVLNIKLPDAAKVNELAVKTAFDTALQHSAFSVPANSQDQDSFGRFNHQIAQDAANGGQHQDFVTPDKVTDSSQFNDDYLVRMNQHYNSQQRKKGA